MAAVRDPLAMQDEPVESPWLESVMVNGFQGNRDFRINFSKNANFLIGKNGCGKTTLINLINAGLSGESSSLFRSNFSELTLCLSFGPENSKYTISYRKIRRDDRPHHEIEFKIIGPRKGTIYKQTIHNREAYGYREGYRAFGSGVYYDSGPTFDIEFAFSKSSKKRPVTTWLSIHRAEFSRATTPETAMQSPIDRKLEELSKRTSSYLSALDSRASERSANFQKDYFLSLIGYKGGDAFSMAVSAFNSLDLQVEEDNLAKILSHLKLGLIDYRHKLKAHFDDARRLLQTEKTSYTVQDALKIADTLRIHELNEKWLAFERDRADIYNPKTVFIDIVNKIFVTKSLSFSDRNQPIFHLDKRRRLEIADLSSGEKQAYIILSEALVQEEKRAIYLADEPELSLHVEWQQFLVENIFLLNPQCQLIFATHSPDILGAYGENAIDVERL